MLEKTKEIKLLLKLRAILLMEADFHAVNKIVLGTRMLENVHCHDLMPEEIFSKKHHMADDGILVKVLFYVIVWQLHGPVDLASVDATNCYDQFAHTFASLVSRSFGSTATISQMLCYRL
jgi:hypothetical protein